MGDERTEQLRRSAEARLESNTIPIEEQRLQQAIARQFAQKVNNATDKLTKEDRDSLPFLAVHPYGLKGDRADYFAKLPPNNQTKPDSHWLIEMQALGPMMTTIGIEVLGDIVLGLVKAGSMPPDLDLGPYGAEEKGVSRRHAVIRPSRNRLYLIDLQSTNGTRVNALAVNPGIAMEIHTNDTVSLGAFTFTIKLLAPPDQLAQLRKEAEI